MQSLLFFHFFGIFSNSFGYFYFKNGQKWPIFGVKKVVPIFAKKLPKMGVFETKTVQSEKCETLEGIILLGFRGFWAIFGYFFIF